MVPRGTRTLCGDTRTASRAGHPATRETITWVTCTIGAGCRAGMRDLKVSDTGPRAHLQISKRSSDRCRPNRQSSVETTLGWVRQPRLFAGVPSLRGCLCARSRDRISRVARSHPCVHFVTKTHAERRDQVAGGTKVFAGVPSLRALGVRNTPISKNRRSTGVAPRGENVALGKEKRSR